ncbi:MAG: RHS repeat-associated core domain-containing protein [Ruminococcus sp.]|nr:RHS repeat-associated core domain-containing protein [Ruminococcus sp.]
MIYYIRDEDGSLIGLKYNDKNYYYIKNMQEDIIGIADSNNNKLCSYEYDSWGNIISIKDNTNNEITDTSHIALINPFRYRSYYYDEETKLYYLNSRYYNPEWGRFINIDAISGEIGEVTSHNMYKYANNNPINYGDEDGNKAKWWQKVLIGVGAIAVGSIVAGVAIGLSAGATAGTTFATAAALGGAKTTAVAGAKAAVTIGTVSAGTRAVKKTVQSASQGNSAKTVAKEVLSAAIDGFSTGFAVGGATTLVSGLAAVGTHSDGLRIGKTDKEQYGRLSIGYGTQNPQGMTLINFSNKSGKSRFRVDADSRNLIHMHYGKTKSQMDIHRKTVTNIIFGIIGGL